MHIWVNTWMWGRAQEECAHEVWSEEEERTAGYTPVRWSLPPALGTSENYEVQQKEFGHASVDLGASQVMLVVKDPSANAGEG